MFCSKCGKTIRPEDSICPSCQEPIGDNRFGGTPYTSAQFTIAPGQTTFEPLNDYTRTTYTSMDDAQQENGEIDSRTTYRPVYEGASAPEDVRREMREALSGKQEEDEEEAPAESADIDSVPFPLSPAAQEALDELDEDLRPDEAIDRSQFISRPIQSNGRAGISQDVSEYIRKLEDGQSRRSRSRRSYNEYDDYARDESIPEDYAAEPYEGEDLPEGEVDDFDDEEFEDEPGRFGIGQILKVIIGVILAAALIAGGIYWIRHVRGNTSSAPIEGVSETLYDDGLALVKSHVETDYVNGLISMYQSEGPLAMGNRIVSDSAAIDALMPAEPAVNDQTFIDALQAIQSNIANSITMDALSIDSNSSTKLQDSEARWQSVNASLAQLESATSAAELTAIINAPVIKVEDATPEPTATPTVYNTLTKGDKSNAVLELQVRLYNLGYLNDDRDGAFGAKTQTAVKAFQQKAGLNVTGIADNDTQTLLFSDDAPYAPGKETPVPTPAPTEEPQMIQPAEAAEAQNEAPADAAANS